MTEPDHPTDMKVQLMGDALGPNGGRLFPDPCREAPTDWARLLDPHPTTPIIGSIRRRKWGVTHISNTE